MRNGLAIVGYTFRQHLRNRIFLGILWFGLMIIVGSIAISSLASNEQGRVLLNFGLFAIELIAMLSIIFVMVGLILEEMESKSIYLILSHPIHRADYIVGRFFGTLTAIWIGMMGMTIIHIILLSLFGEPLTIHYFYSILCSMGKVMLIGSLALFISLITTSTTSSMILTLFFWILGHFNQEINNLAEKSDGLLTHFSLNVIYYLVPNLSIFNYRDFYSIHHAPGFAWAIWLFFYGISYTGGVLYFAHWLFSRKEF